MRPLIGQIVGILLGALVSAGGAVAKDRVDLLLVLAIDASGSTRGGDFLTQIRGHAAAFRDPSVITALTAGPERRIAAAVIVWSDDAQQWRCVDWTAIASLDDGVRFAKALERCPFIGGGTSIGGALRNARTELGWSPFTAPRRIIDISANERSGMVIEPSRYYAIRDGITINALVIESGKESLIPYFSRFVIGGPGAFVITATPESYAESLLWKLQIETAGVAGTTPPQEARVRTGDGPPDPGQVITPTQSNSSNSK
ncbi:MAG: DUF1194 domain-containing protein [Alphaproteobacteria bacterium]|nr:DUF1194 domain-containing protein [Alphaproteobacteria bacterium]